MKRRDPRPSAARAVTRRRLRRMLLLWPLAACADADAGPPLVVQRDTVGDTVFVHWASGSLWGSPVTPRERLEIGELDGSEEETFGLVTELAVDPDGGILVFDAQVPALRYFDARGRFVRTIGGGGAGPGEYRDAVRGLAVRSDGTILLRDMRNRRVNLYAADGEPLAHWRVESGLFTSQAMTVDTAGHVYLKVLLGQNDPSRPLPRPWPVGLLHLDPDGAIVDTLAPPRIGGAQAGVWALHPEGHLVVGSGEEYAFEIRRADGTVVRVSRSHTPVALTEAERAAYEALRRREEPDGRPQAEIPRTKRAYRSFYTGRDGRIWVHRFAAAEPLAEGEPPPGPMQAPAPGWGFKEPMVFDVFETDGTYLGEVRLPWNVEPHVFGRDEIHAVRRGKYGEQYVVRFALGRG